MSTLPPTPPLQDRGLIVLNITPIEQTFYLVTQETLDAYANTGNFSNLFLTIFGICAGGFLTCWVAERTSAVAKEVQMAVATVKFGLLVFGAIFLILSLYFVIRTRKLRSSIFKLPPTSIPVKR